MEGEGGERKRKERENDETNRQTDAAKGGRDDENRTCKQERAGELHSFRNKIKWVNLCDLLFYNFQTEIIVKSWKGI
jgi:hypothetical protein